LEGLTSNLFVVYNNGKIIRTPSTENVLGGYIRQLIVDKASSWGYTIEIGPIDMQDSSLWEEVFLTSSVRLLVPIQTIVVPTDMDDSKGCITKSRIVWEKQVSSSLQEDGTAFSSACDIIYQHIMKDG
jgi:branched-subunit amino acid aminotransferase/4-amino-4-deoxychorismate lyase